MATQHHSRSSGSSISSCASSAPYQLILDHILSYPGSYEIPLRTMYTLNCQPRGQNLSGASSAASSPVTPQGSFPDSQTTETFTQNLMAQLSNLPSQVSSLPPSFITSFVLRCFPAELTHVDFPQALTGLDYLKDLETRRRREVAAAMQRLGIDKDSLPRDADGVSEKYPGVAQWVKSIEEKERKIDGLYTQIWVFLRRWILINEMYLAPFNKHNCVAMLNTLYPPMGAPVQPASRLTPKVLKTQRDGYFKYIQAVERNGPGILTTLMNQGKLATDANGWPAGIRQLSMYLQVANSIITEAMAIVEPQDVSPEKKHESNQVRHTRKADSGISFTSDQRPSTRGSGSEPTSPAEPVRPKTPNSTRPGTALEKLARGLRGIGRGRTDATEMISDEDETTAAPVVERPRMLRKIRSLGSLGDRKNSISGASTRQGSPAPAFDPKEMRLQRAKYEARLESGKRSSN